jgi:hypothetical protein
MCSNTRSKELLRLSSMTTLWPCCSSTNVVWLAATFSSSQKSDVRHRHTFE